MHPAKKFTEALSLTPLLTKFQLFEAAELSQTQDNEAIFKFLIQNGKLLKTGEKRGTKYYLASQNLEELLAKQAEDAAVVEEEVVVEPKKAKLTEDEVEDRVTEAKASIIKFGETNKVFSFDELTNGVEDFPSHILRKGLRDLLDEETLFETMNKRGKRYSFDEVEIDKAEDGGRQVEIDQICKQVMPFFTKKAQGITTASILEEFPEIRKHVLYLALNQLEDEGKIERFGQGKSSNFSVAGKGEVEKIGSFNSDRVIEIKNRVRIMILEMRVVRPLILESKLDIERRLLDTALDMLVNDDKVFKYDGERRAKVIACLDADEDEITKARDEQPSRSSEVCDDLSRLVCNGYSFAAVQRDGQEIVVRRTANYDPTNKTILHDSASYGDFLNYMKELLHASNQDLDEDARIGTAVS